MPLGVCIYIYTHTHTHTHIHIRGFPGGVVVKNPPANARDMCLIPRSGRFLEK